LLYASSHLDANTAVHLRALGTHAITHHNTHAFTAPDQRHLSTDLATGTAGILLAVHTATSHTTNPTRPALLGGR
jgi:hypothetical protein